MAESESEVDLLENLVNRAKIAACYCWHMNGKSDDEDALHKFLGVSHEVYCDWMVKNNFMKENTRKVTRRTADSLVNQIVGPLSGDDMVCEINPFTSNRLLYLVLGNQNAVEPIFTAPKDQYDESTRPPNLIHEPKLGHHIPTIEDLIASLRNSEVNKVSDVVCCKGLKSEAL